MERMNRSESGRENITTAEPRKEFYFFFYILPAYGDSNKVNGQNAKFEGGRFFRSMLSLFFHPCEFFLAGLHARVRLYKLVTP